MDEPQVSLGSIALQRNNGVLNSALADLMVHVVGMCAFINHEGIPKHVVLEVYDEMVKTSRVTLIDIMEKPHG